MKEEIQDVIEEIKNRLTNPLVGSFIIAWVGINWYIPVLLLFYDQRELKLDGGYNTYREAILSQIKLNYNLWYPLAVAIGYVLIMPAIKGIINWYQEKVRVYFENKIVDETSKIKSFEQRIRLKDECIEVLEAEHAKQIEMIKTLTDERKSYVDTNNNLTKVVKDFSIAADNIFGSWYMNKNNSDSANVVWIIKGNEIIERTHVSDAPKYKIVKKIGSNINVLLVLQESPNNTLHVVDLTAFEGTDMYVGTLNTVTPLTLKRSILLK